MAIKTPRNRNLRIDEISGFHPLVQPVAGTLASRSFCSRFDVLSECSVRGLIQLHPIQLVHEKNEFYVIAGFRSYQLGISRLGNEKFPVCIHSQLDDDRILDMANIDILGSPLLHSLGTKSASQIEQIMAQIGRKEALNLAPGLKTARSVVRFEKSV